MFLLFAPRVVSHGFIAPNCCFLLSHSSYSSRHSQLFAALSPPFFLFGSVRRTQSRHEGEPRPIPGQPPSPLDPSRNRFWRSPLWWPSQQLIPKIPSALMNCSPLSHGNSYLSCCLPTAMGFPPLFSSDPKIRPLHLFCRVGLVSFVLRAHVANLASLYSAPCPICENKGTFVPC